MLTELGEIELDVPRSRRISAVGVVRAYARRVGHIDRMILSCFVLELSTRKGDLYRRGVSGKGTEGVNTDGEKGLLAALPLVYPRSVIQRCGAHKSRNVLTYVRKTDWQAVKKDLHKINAKNLSKAQRALGKFCGRWGKQYPKAIKCLVTDEKQGLKFFSN